MKIMTTFVPVLAAALVLTATGCKKEEPTIPQKVADETKSVAETTSDALKSAATEVKAGAEKAVEQVKDAAASVKAAATDKAQSLIDEAKSLFAAGKLQEALTALGNLNGLTLTDAQQKLVDGLKAQIQKALSEKAAAQGASAVGNLLGK